MNMGDRQWKLQLSLVVGGGYRNSLLTKASSPGEFKARIDNLVQALDRWATDLPEQRQ